MTQNSIILAINDLDFGGGQRTVVQEANELHRRGIPVHVVTTLLGARLPLQKLLHIPPDQVHHVPFSSFVDVGAYAILIRLIIALHPHAVVTNLFFTNTVMRLALLCFPAVHVVVREGNVHTGKRFFARLMDALLSLRTRAVTGNSENVVKSIDTLAFFTKKLVLYNGIDDVFFAPSLARASVRSELSIAPDRAVLLIVASLTPKKGIRTALDALALLPAQEKTTLVIVGDGPERARLEAHVRELGIGNRALFAGARANVRDMFAASDIFILSSLWEGMPNALLEAMAAGLPVIATNVGGVSEIVENGENGYLVSAGDTRALSVALATLLKNPVLCERLGARARQSVSHLTWERHVTRLLEIAS